MCYDRLKGFKSPYFAASCVVAESCLSPRSSNGTLSSRRQLPDLQGEVGYLSFITSQLENLATVFSLSNGQLLTRNSILAIELAQKTSIPVIPLLKSYLIGSETAYGQEVMLRPSASAPFPLIFGR